MNKKKITIGVLIFATLCLIEINVRAQKQQIDCDPFKGEHGGFWYRYQIFNPYSFLSYKSFGMLVMKDTSACVIKYNFVIHMGAISPPYDTMRILFNKCDPQLSIYEYVQTYEEYPFKKIPFFSAKLYMMDTLQFKYQETTYTLKKYKAVLPDSQMISIYFCDTLGVIKQYASFRSVSHDNIEMEWRSSKCPQMDLVNAFLNALYERDDFHERYDDGPRTIRGKILDRKKFREAKKRYKKMGLI